MSITVDEMLSRIDSVLQKREIHLLHKNPEKMATCSTRKIISSGLITLFLLFLSMVPNISQNFY